MGKVYLIGINMLIFGLLALGTGGCGGETCADFNGAVMNLCSSDCEFSLPETYQIVQSECSAIVEGFSIEDLGEDFNCTGEIELSLYGASYFLTSTSQVCTGSEGTSCTISMAGAEIACP